jgi:hypothetical protein
MLIYVDVDNVMSDTALAKFGYIPDEYGQPGSFSDLSVDWWMDLPKTPEADDLMAALRKTPHKIVFCTKTCSKDCTMGKAYWLQKHYPEIDYMIVTTKEHLTGLIIDDHPNLKFGGHQIMWPQPYNKAKAEDKVKHVMAAIRKITGWHS